MRHRSRSGISLMEVLIGVFVLSIGLLGVAAMIPIGKLAMIETAKSDRTGACGRAALREVKIRRMLDPDFWSTAAPTTNPFIIDPLYYAVNSSLPAFGPLQRIGLKNLTTVAQVNSVFRWKDDLIYLQPRDAIAGTVPSNGERPAGLFASDEAYASTGTTTTAYPASEGNYSWFLTVSPQIVNSIATGTYSVAAVVCHKRIVSSSAESTFNVKCDSSPGYGGIGISYTKTSSTATPKANEWVMLYSNVNGQCTWYRVASVGNYGTDVRVNLVGPDWFGGATTNGAKAVVLGGVTGVYVTTVQLDNDLTWRIKTTTSP